MFSFRWLSVFMSSWSLFLKQQKQDLHQNLDLYFYDSSELVPEWTCLGPAPGEDPLQVCVKCSISLSNFGLLSIAACDKFRFPDHIFYSSIHLKSIFFLFTVKPSISVSYFDSLIIPGCKVLFLVLFRAHIKTPHSSLKIQNLKNFVYFFLLLL